MHPRHILTPSWLLKAAYFTGARRWANRFQQWLFERSHVRMPVPRFPTVAAAIRYVSPTFSDWSSDRDRGAWWSDWSSHPEVTQARILAAPGPVGDCDDFAAWYCAAIAGAVDAVHRISVWTWDGGHTAVVFRLGSKMYLLDYGRVTELQSYPHGATVIARRYGYGLGAGWVVETPDLRLVASS